MILGIISLIVGLVLYFVGKAQNNDWEYCLESYLKGGSATPGDTFIYIGIGLCILGVVLIVLRVLKGSKAKANIEAEKRYEKAKVEETKKAEPVAPKKEEKACPFCGAMIGVNSAFCAKCGKDVRKFKCVNCGKELDAGTKFCTSCGTPTEK